MKIQYTKTNFMHMEETYIGHGTNCQGVMGAGVAKAIRSKYPEAYKEYKTLCNANADDKTQLLGTIHAVETNGKVILNLFTQLGFGHGIQIDYDAIRSCFRILNTKAKELGITRIGFPKIGAGLGGGNWETIATIIEEESTNFQPVVSEYTR